MSTLILLRHAQASFGADKYDALSDRGHMQAKILGQFWAERAPRFDQILVGPRDRHRLTAKLALSPIGLNWQVEATPELDEFAEGQQILASVKQRQRHTLDGKEAARQYAREIDDWSAGRVELSGIRSAASFRADVGRWLHDATTQSKKSGQSLLAVTSGGVIAAVMCIVLDLPDAKLSAFMNAIHNASLTQLAFSAGRSPSLQSFNVAGHLPDDMLTRL
tara:strand:- start:2774 stop:3433 length:660 start_codon:yes stop_codon:yes gene_type:complete